MQTNMDVFEQWLADEIIAADEAHTMAVRRHADSVKVALLKERLVTLRDVRRVLEEVR